MKDKIGNLTKKNAFIIALILAAVVKQLLVVGLPIYAIPAAACDDQLMKNWAYSMAVGDWTGAFNAYTFMKEPGFSLFLAICYRLHLPFIFTLTLGYSIACGIFSTALNKIFSSKVFVYIIYIVLLFNPLSYSLYTLQRVYRNGLGVVLTLLIFGGTIHMYFSVFEEKQWKLAIWACITGLSLGYLWITKSDTIWVMPFVAVVSIVMFGMLLKNHRNVKSIPRYLFLTIPFIGIFLFTHLVEFCNVNRYGYPSVEYYGAALYDMTHVKTENPIDKVGLSRETLEELYEVSPTLASVEDELEEAMDKNGLYDTHPEDGEVEDGWVGWALLEAFNNADVYESCETANEFYKNVYDELEAAFTDGTLEKIESSTAQSYYLDTKEHRSQLFQRTWDAVQYMMTFADTKAEVKMDDDSGIGARDFEQLTREKAVYEKMKDDYIATGWIVFPDYSLADLKVYVEDSNGNQFEEIKFKKSLDAYEDLKGSEYETTDARRCRFNIRWDVGEDEAKNETYYLSVYQNDTLVGKVEMQEEGFVPVGEFEYKGVLDTYASKRVNETIKSRAESAVHRLNLVGSIYSAAGKGFFYAGVAAYIILTIGMVVDFLRKKFVKVNAWLITTGFGMSIIVFAAGIAVVDLTQCPAVNAMYLSAGYALLLAAEFIAILKCVEMVLVWRKKRSHEVNYEEK